ncbi:hypothetical protein C1637_24030 [Chryseobacterium lactis]|uniref:DUF4197 family protein n=1 Tax=Chryseobacterium lactis TaxID=1241981 RepID=A0A3G6RF18_CHRLC|nr:hypothetical protein [Chryseobacterium lactis]AZA83256.1 hypothetical protein EG342_15840 [Chryseobacterium lactis]AZB03641.1 hypothetical protein EG341_06710 [Chryseobacterium lactis]PNW11149.1 hypothetical protein C1637_24030 [Chryseobacterium lactis]
MKTNLITKIYFLAALCIFSFSFGKNMIATERSNIYENTIEKEHLPSINTLRHPVGNLYQTSMSVNTSQYVNGPVDLISVLQDLGLFNLIPIDTSLKLLSIVSDLNTCLAGINSTTIDTINQIIASIISSFQPMLNVLDQLISNGATTDIISKMAKTITMLISVKTVQTIMATIKKSLSQSQWTCLVDALQKLNNL